MFNVLLNIFLFCCAIFLVASTVYGLCNLLLSKTQTSTTPNASETEGVVEFVKEESLVSNKKTSSRPKKKTKKTTKPTKTHKAPPPQKPKKKK